MKALAKKMTASEPDKRAPVGRITRSKPFQRAPRGL